MSSDQSSGTGTSLSESSFGWGPVAAPLALLYGAVTELRGALYGRGWLPQGEAGVPTISVGGIEVGGSGKTPVTEWMLRALLEAGHRPGLLTRGYGRSTRGLVVRRAGELALADTIGDEPAMVVAGGLDVPVAAAARRLEGARALVGEGACDTLVLDDGFAHRALKRDLDIVVLRGERPLGSGHLLPWGSLREPRSGLRRAGVLWFHHKGEGAADAPAWVQAEFPETPVVVSRARPTVPRDLDGAEAPLLGERALVVTGIAHPAPFEASVRRAGAEVVGVKFFRDHHAFDHADVEALLALQATEGASQIVVTPKDAIKLKHLWPDHPLTVLGTQVEVLEGEELLAQKIHEITT